MALGSQTRVYLFKDTTRCPHIRIHSRLLLVSKEVSRTPDRTQDSQDLLYIEKPPASPFTSHPINGCKGIPYSTAPCATGNA